MNLSTKMILDMSKVHLQLVNQRKFRTLKFEDDKDDFSGMEIKEINVSEYDIVEIEDLEGTEETVEGDVE